MEPYEALYGRPCRSPVFWTEVGERPSRVQNWLETPPRGVLDREASYPRSESKEELCRQTATTFRV